MHTWGGGLECISGPSGISMVIIRIIARLNVKPRLAIMGEVWRSSESPDCPGPLKAKSHVVYILRSPLARLHGCLPRNMPGLWLDSGVVFGSCLLAPQLNRPERTQKKAGYGLTCMDDLLKKPYWNETQLSSCDWCRGVSLVLDETSLLPSRWTYTL